MQKRLVHYLANFQSMILLAALLGIACGFWPIPGQEVVASALMTLFMNALRLVSLPIIFLAVSTTIMGMETLADLAWLGRWIFTYTFLTTTLAASIALLLFIALQPKIDVEQFQVAQIADAVHDNSYTDYLLRIVPKNAFEPFVEGNVMAVVFMAVVLGVAMLQIPERHHLHAPLSALLKGLLRVIRAITKGVPLIVWAGIVESFSTLGRAGVAPQLFCYLACVVVANLFQAFGILPLLLRLHGIAPRALAQAFTPALHMAFFSKSSVATLPVAIRCAEEKQHLDPKIVRFSFPMCTTINMNGCAAFILLTVLFVSTSHGHHYSLLEMVGMMFLSVIAALGNAGVPMGCYFLSCALLAAMGVPLTLMTLILPFYSFIDMLETAVNVWSDACVTTLVDKHQRTKIS